MKFNKPLFSIFIIFVQLILSLKEYYNLQEWRKENPDLDALISINKTYDSLFLFILIIGFYEMLSKSSWYKTIIRLFLVVIILGTQFSDFIPIDQFYYGVYNTAWFSAVIACFLILVKIGKSNYKKTINSRLKNTDV